LPLRVGHRLPGWLEQLPQLPETLLERGQAPQQAQHDALRLQLQQAEIQAEQRDRRARNQRLGIVALLAAALIADPEISLGLQSLPTASLALLGAGLYFLIRSR